MGSTGREQWYLEESNSERFLSFHCQIHTLICSHTCIVRPTRSTDRCSATHIPHQCSKNLHPCHQASSICRKRLAASTNILHLHIMPISRSQIPCQRPSEQLEQHLKTYPRDRGVIPSLAELITDEGVLGPSHLVETESRARIVQSLADEVAAGGRDVRILLPEDLEFFSNPMINFLHLPADYYGWRVASYAKTLRGYGEGGCEAVA